MRSRSNDPSPAPPYHQEQVAQILKVLHLRTTLYGKDINNKLNVPFEIVKPQGVAEGLPETHRARRQC